MGEIIIDSGFGFLKAWEVTLMCIAAFGAIIIMPLCRRIALRIGLVSEKSMPVVGGIVACLFAMAMVLMHINRLLMTGVFVMGMLGIVCDKGWLRGWMKLVCQVVVCLAYLRIGYGAFYPMIWLHLFLMLCVVNAIDLLRGINGLTIAIFVIAFIPLALIGYKLFLTSICGALIVLYYNNVVRHDVALGSGLSLALGFMIAGLIFSPGFVMYGALDQASWYCALDSVMFVLLILPLPLLDMARSLLFRSEGIHLSLARHGIRDGIVSVLMVALNIVGFIAIWMLMDVIEIIL